VAAYRSFREHMHDGPIYTILDTQSLRDEEGFPAVKQFNPFEGVERYSLKYKKLKRTLPNLRTRSYGKSSSSFNLGYIAVADLRTTVKELFPSELWSTLDPDLAAKDRKNPNPSKPFKPQVRLAPFLDSGDRGENPLKRKTIADEDEQDEEEDIQPRGRRKKNPTDDDDNQTIMKAMITMRNSTSTQVMMTKGIMMVEAEGRMMVDTINDTHF